ncbi:unnamed protein product [Darwinula stevensoni]|uniref:Limulus clotting factor C n=1 Tax=Darwinula stevensoni TaxID=69355 RepID=A0A7R8XC90_9CRUS|nr:unnamed protein product [Darwinula stevensoni]CAG0893545.1 unnamed protein product [Darwinula stevensoni]
MSGVIGCGQLSTIQHGSFTIESCGSPSEEIAKRSNASCIQDESYAFSSIVRYRCEKYYELQGPEFRRCAEDGEWTGPTPFCKPVCGKKASQIQLSAGGNPSEIGEWPWQAAIYDIKIGDVTYGGALIREEWVLTAAHCVVVDGTIRTRHSEEIFVYLGKHYRSYIKIDEHVSHIILHTEFNFYNNYDSDIALLKLRRPAVLTARVQLVCLPNRFDLSEANLDSGVPGWVAGWGYDDSDELAAVLTEVQLPVISNRECVRDTRHFTEDPSVTRTLTSNMFCAGFSVDTPIKDFRTVCEGDSGSPMVFFSNTSHDGHWTMEGIVSHFFQKGACSMRRPGQYGIFTKVNRFTQWISRVIHSGF